MSHADAEKKYRQLGLVTRNIKDEPGTIYKPHRHERVYLYSLAGSVKIKLDDGDWLGISPGDEVRIHDLQLHEAEVGDEGWEYVIAASPEEIRRQGL